MRVLLVEDDADAAESTALLLRLWGHEVHVAPDGPCALEAGPAFQPHVVLLDLGLPGMDGFQVARQFREQPALRKATLVALTGFGDDANCRRSRQAGIALHLVKPVDPDRLQDLLSEMAAEREFPGASVIAGATGVTVAAVRGGKVRLGVTAPTSARADRREVHERRRGSDPPIPASSVPLTSEGGGSGQTAQPGDRVQVHYVKRFQDGSAVSSRDGTPLELTVGVDHQRLPGLGLALVGLVPGTSTTVSVPAGRAYPPANPARVHRWARTRFPQHQPLRTGEWVRILGHHGRSRMVRILEVGRQTVVVDTNHRRAGQALELEVELVGIRAPDAGSDGREP